MPNDDNEYGNDSLDWTMFAIIAVVLLTWWGSLQ